MNTAGFQFELPHYSTFTECDHSVGRGISSCHPLPVHPAANCTILPAPDHTSVAPNSGTNLTGHFVYSRNIFVPKDHHNDLNDGNGTISLQSMISVHPKEMAAVPSPALTVGCKHNGSTSENSTGTQQLKLALLKCFTHISR